MGVTSQRLTLGLHYYRAGRLADAEAIFREVLAAEPDNADALHLMAVLAHQVGRDDVAVPYLEAALARQPDRPDFHGNLGEIMRASGHYPEAAHHFRRALALDPDFADAHNNYGLLCQAEGRVEEAASHYRRALDLVPGFPEAHNNLGNALKEQRLPELAAVHYRKALALQPAYPEAHANLAAVLLEQGLPDQAASHYRQALAARPDFAIARFGLCMAQLPVAYRDEAEIQRCREAYTRVLSDFHADVVGGLGNPAVLAAAVGSHQPFFLAYQGRDDRALQAIYGDLVVRAMAGAWPPLPLSALPVPAPGEPIRVGFVSGYFFDHSVWKMPVRGWLSHLDRRRFRIFAYHTRALRDAETARAEGLSDVFVQGPLPLAAWRERILADAPHILIYPEIGMDPVTAQLAAQRLARVQCTSWGHPETCGLPTIDAYLSSDLMEPPEGDCHYTETLVRLPNLSVHYEPPTPPAQTVTRAELGLRPDAVVFWCCQSLFKYLPHYDAVFPRIAAGVGDCQFAFLGYQGGDHVGALFRDRLDAAFAAAGARASDHVAILPRLSTERFIAAGRVMDVYLDSIGWSGINSTLECALTGLPIVTLPGSLMRGRHTMAVLRMMDIPETIATDVDAYVAIAIRLAKDLAWRAEIRRKVEVGRERLWRDMACVTALEDFIVRAVSAP